MADDSKTQKQKNTKTEKQDKKLSKKVESLVDDIAKLSVMELSDLVNALQDKLGVTAAAPTATAPASTTGGSGEAKPAESEAGSGSSTQTLTMTGAGDNKIAVIKALREINQNLSLMDAKGMTESVPAEILKDAKAEEAKEAADKLKAAGAQIELK